MNAEIIAVGTELLLGQVVDTNSAWIGRQLALAGIDSHYQTKVGDNFERLEGAFRQALDRSDAVIVCGGLGPTPDDITREVLAAVMGAELRADEQIAARIRSMFTGRGRQMPRNNLRQALVPVGASPIPQQPGTAPGLIAPIRWVRGVGAVAPGAQPPAAAQALERVVYLVPGVPYEMREMMEGTVLADLRQRAGVTAAIESRVLRTWGQSESGLAEMLAGCIDRLDEVANPTLAFLASGIEGIKLRITAKGAGSAEAWDLIGAVQREVEDLLGDLVFAYDEDNMEMAVLAELGRQGLTLAVAETITGGRMANRLTSAEAAMVSGVTPGGAALGDPGLGDPGLAAAPAQQARQARRDRPAAGSGTSIFAGGIVAHSQDLVAKLAHGISHGTSDRTPDGPTSDGASQAALDGPSDGASQAAPDGPSDGISQVASAAGAVGLARAARLCIGADVGLAVTAAADPASPSAPYRSGTAFLAVSLAGRSVAGRSVTPAQEAPADEILEQVRLPGDRERLADFAAISALNLLRLKLKGRLAQPPA